MAYIGMRSPIVAKVASRVDGSEITYDTPLIVGPAVSANITFDTADNPDYGDDVIVDNDKGINGYNVTLETNDISKEARAVCLGWKPVMDDSQPPKIIEYKVIGGEVPEVGMGFVRVKMFRGVRKYETFFFHALQFSNSGENASTKQKQITWNHPSMGGTGIGCYLDDSGEVRFFDWMEWADDEYDDALAWIYGKFGANVPTAEESATPAAGGGSTPSAEGGGSSGGT